MLAIGHHSQNLGSVSKLILLGRRRRMADVDPQRSGRVRSRIAEAMRKARIQPDCVARPSDVNAIADRDLELAFQHETELETLVVERRPAAGGAWLVPVLGQLVTSRGVADDDPAFDTGAGADDLLVLGSADDRMPVRWLQ